MSEFDSIAQELQRQAEAEDKRQREDDNALLGRVLEIYGQKYVAEQLRKLGQNEWSRERLNRRVNGKGTPAPLPPPRKPYCAKCFLRRLRTIRIINSALSTCSPVLAASVMVLKPLADSVSLPANGTKMRCGRIKLTGTTTKEPSF
jgi:hypothetical protein